MTTAAPALLAGPAPQLAGQLQIAATVLTRVASNETLMNRKEIAMFSLIEISRTTQQIICMALAVVTVAASLTAGAYGAYAAADTGYSVTITQIA